MELLGVMVTRNENDTINTTVSTKTNIYRANANPKRNI